MSLYTIKSVLVLDSEGKRICGKYYTNELATVKEQLQFEKLLFNKTYRANAEILMWDNTIAVYRSCADVIFYVTGGYEQNELVLINLLSAFVEAISKLLRNQVDKRTMLENLDYVILALDELVDGGIILESDPSIIANRVAMKEANSDIPLSEQTISQALQSAREQIARSLLKS
mmetsp:Transcript_15016/g.21004  ORF Transcript_15016/g.21004 Transcript_15016/m.21004 type:complete len:174 (+) Transcript_15016:85-606(+)